MHSKFTQIVQNRLRFFVLRRELSLCSVSEKLPGVRVLSCPLTKPWPFQPEQWAKEGRSEKLLSLTVLNGTSFMIDFLKMQKLSEVIRMM